MAAALFTLGCSLNHGKSPVNESSTTGAPNIIFIMADDLGFTDLSSDLTSLGHGSDFFETPNIDRLAEQGLSFTSCRTQPNCAPTRAAILTGQYPPRSGNGVYNVSSLNRGPIKASDQRRWRDETYHQGSHLVPPRQSSEVPASSITLAEILSDHGYTTAHFGKYHVGGLSPGTLPEEQGFDHNYGGCMVGAHATCFASETEAGWTFASAIGRPDLDRFAKPYDAAYLAAHALPLWLEASPKHLSDALGDALIDFLSVHHRTKSGTPFYVQYHAYSPHEPHESRPDLRARFAARAEGAYHSDPAYAGFVSGLDETVGRLLAFLDDPDADGDSSDSIASRTLVIFTSDNGGGAGTNNHPLRRAKGTFYDGGLRVPLIARQPGVVTSRRVSQVLIHSVDFYPTIAELADAPLPDPQLHSIDGESFASVVRGATTRDRQRPICYYFPGYMDDRAWPLAVTISEHGGRRYKLLHSYETGHTELYDLGRDIGEKHNLLEGEKNARSVAVARTMITELNAWLVRDDPTWAPARMTDRTSGELVPLMVPFG